MAIIKNMSHYAAVKTDGEDVLGKILYYALSSILVDKGELGGLCEALGFPYHPSKRLALADAFRSATGDVYERKVVETPEGPICFKVYCRDNRAGKNTISRELVKETVQENTNDYKKLANISFDKKSGVFSYDNLAFDPHVDPLGFCLQARELFELYQRCAGRKQIETLLENYLDSLHAVKVVSHGKVYFVPRDHMAQVALFEDFVEALETHNCNPNPLRPPLDSNSMFVVDDEKQRSKMAAAFYRAVRREIQEYEERANHLIQTGNQSPAVMERMVLRIQGLEQKKRHYEEVLQRELHDVDDAFSTLRYLAQELQIRTRGIRAQKKRAA